MGVELKGPAHAKVMVTPQQLRKILKVAKQFGLKQLKTAHFEIEFHDTAFSVQPSSPAMDSTSLPLSDEEFLYASSPIKFVSHETKDGEA